MHSRLMECWLDIEGYENHYQISNLGRVLSRVSGKYLKFDIVKGGYLRVTLYKKGRRKRFLIQHLVLQTFVGDCPLGMEACHNNGIPADNQIINLRWDTRSNNNLDKAKHGTHQWGERNGNSKLTEVKVKEIRHLLKAGYSQRRVASQLNISQTNVCDIGLRNIWRYL